MDLKIKDPEIEIRERQTNKQTRRKAFTANGAWFDRWAKNQSRSCISRQVRGSSSFLSPLSNLPLFSKRGTSPILVETRPGGSASSNYVAVSGGGKDRGRRFVPSRGNWMPACRQLIRHTSLEHRRSTRIAASCIFPLKLPLTIPPLPSLLPSSVHFRPIKNAVILGNRCLNARWTSIEPFLIYFGARKYIGPGDG